MKSQHYYLLHLNFIAGFNFFNFGGQQQAQENVDGDQNDPNLRQSIEVPKPYPGFEKVTYNSMVKLTNAKNFYKLNSQTAQYGTGSGQQIVTAHPSANQMDSYWIILPPINGEKKSMGEPVNCNDIIQLKHSSTGGYLHSHLHKSPISQQQEVSAFDDTDSGNNWQVKCYTNKDTKAQPDAWLREQPVSLIHVDTGKHLGASSSNQYNHPIASHIEVFAAPKSASDELKWISQEGIYFSNE